MPDIWEGTQPQENKFKTQDEYLWNLQSLGERQYAPSASSGGESVSTNAPAPQDTSSYQTPPPAWTPPTTPQQEYQAPESGQISLEPWSPSYQITGTYAKLFNPLQSQLSQQSQYLGGLVGNFNQAVGTQPTVASVPGVMEAGIAAAPGTEARQRAQGYLQQAYTGPQGISATDLEQVTKAWPTFLSQGRALDQPQGVAELYKVLSPSLTPGELRYEAGRTYKDPEYLKAAELTQQDISKFYGDLLRTQGEATALAKERANQAASVASEAQNYLTQGRGALEQGAQQKVGEAAAREADIQSAYNKYKQEGTLESLQAIPEQYRPGVTPNEYYTTPGRNLLSEAQAAQQAIMDKYPDLKDVPLLERSDVGAAKFPTEWWDANQNRADIAEVKRQAKARQKELEKAGFSPKVWAEGKTPTYDYSTVMPLYYGDQFQPVDTTQYIQRNAAVNAPAGEVSPEQAVSQFLTDPEVERYNAILGLLGSEPIVNDPNYQGSMVKGDLNAYLAAEQQRMKDAQNSIDANILSQMATGSGLLDSIYNTVLKNYQDQLGYMPINIVNWSGF